MLSNVQEFEEKGCGMLRNVIKMLTNVGVYNVVKCDGNFKRFLLNVRECWKILFQMLTNVGVY